MKKFLIHSIVLLAVQSFAQSGLNDIIIFSDYLVDQNNYHDALKELHRVLCFSKETDIWGQVYFKMGLCYRELGDNTKSIEMFNTAQNYTSSNDQLFEIITAKASGYIVLENYSLAQLELLSLLQKPIDEVKKKNIYFLLFISAVYAKNWPKANEFLSDYNRLNDKECFPRLNNILKKTETSKTKNPNVAKWLSTFIPGSGQLYAGEYKNFANSLILNCLNLTANISLFAAGDTSGAVWYYLFITDRFYRGGRYQAEQSVYRVRDEQNENIQREILNVLNNYPAFTSTSNN